MRVIGIDPGISGALVILDGPDLVIGRSMPILKNGKNTEVDFDVAWDFLEDAGESPIFLERAMPMAMGAKHAFNYGRGFAALEIAVQLVGYPVTYVEPQKWSKVIHQGVDSRLKPKEKSLIAFKRLFPKLYGKIPTNRNGKLHDGIVDAILIAAYGQRLLKGN